LREDTPPRFMACGCGSFGCAPAALVRLVTVRLVCVHACCHAKSNQTSDNCTCGDCRDPETLQRNVDTQSLASDLTPAKVDVDTATGALRTVWPDGHVSTFDAAWLARHAYWWFGPEPSFDTRPKQHHFSAGTFDVDSMDCSAYEKLVTGGADGMGTPTEPMGLPAVAYDDVMGSEEGVYKWLALVHHFGFAFVHGVPHTMEATEAVSR